MKELRDFRTFLLILIAFFISMNANGNPEYRESGVPAAKRWVANGERHAPPVLNFPAG
jgi:hypothetical protein